MPHDLEFLWQFSNKLKQTNEWMTKIFFAKDKDAKNPTKILADSSSAGHIV